MLRNFLLSLGLFVFSISAAYCMSFTEAQEIYKRIAIYNHFINPPPLKLDPDNTLNAYYTGFNIYINQGALDKTNTDELALILAHELGHWRSNHSMSTPNNEFEADAKGRLYMKNSGYDVCRGKKLFLKFKPGGSSTHPDPMERYNRLQC